MATPAKEMTPMIVKMLKACMIFPDRDLLRRSDRQAGTNVRLREDVQ